MSNDQSNPNDPLGFMRNMWGSMGFSLPGMVTPTFDVNELDKRIKDLKAVEGWLRMNLTMLQATIQGLEMQVGTLNAVKAMGNMATGPAQETAPAAPGGEPSSAGKTTPEAPDPFSQAALWPWQMMQQMQEQLLQQSEAAKAKASEKPSPAAKKAAPKRPRNPSAKN